MIYVFRPWVVKALKIVELIIGLIGLVSFFGIFVIACSTDVDMYVFIKEIVVGVIAFLCPFAGAGIQSIIEKDEEKRHGQV